MSSDVQHGGMDDLIRTARKVILLDRKVSAWSMTIPSPPGRQAGKTDVTFFVDSKDPAAITAATERVARIWSADSSARDSGCKWAEPAVSQGSRADGIV